MPTYDHFMIQYFVLECKTENHHKNIRIWCRNLSSFIMIFGITWNVVFHKIEEPNIFNRNFNTFSYSYLTWCD